MTYGRAVVLGTCVLLLMLAVQPGMAADAPVPKEGHWVVRDFRFHTGEVLPELRLHYTTIGAPSGEPVLILHGTTGSGQACSRRPLAASYSVRASPWTRAATMSFSPTRSVTANRANHRMACARASPDTTTTTWSRPTIDS
jgi:hypothetical protein